MAVKDPRRQFKRCQVLLLRVTLKIPRAGDGGNAKVDDVLSSKSNQNQNQGGVWCQEHPRSKLREEVAPAFNVGT